MTNIAVCLLSGGIDSCVAATLSKKAGDKLYLLSIDSEQLQIKELDNARMIAEKLQPKDHKFMKIIGFNQLSPSALTGHEEIPVNNTLEENIEKTPVTYPRGRDPLYIEAASAWAETLLCQQIIRGEKINAVKVIVGTNKEDSLVYPDCDDLYYTPKNETFAARTRKLDIPMAIHTPLINLTKKQVIQLGYEIGAPLELTRSCYKNEDDLCGECNPCRIVYFAFKDLGIDNPFKYQKIPIKRYS